jgi:hypothetical protein
MVGGMTFVLDATDDLGFNVGQRVAFKATLRAGGSDYLLGRIIVANIHNYRNEAVISKIWIGGLLFDIGNPLRICFQNDGTITDISVNISGPCESVSLIDFFIDQSLTDTQAFEQAITYDNTSKYHQTS